jgi:hypothetical protein
VAYCFQGLRILTSAIAHLLCVQVVLNPDDNLVDSLRAMGLEVEVEAEGDDESEDSEEEEEDDDEEEEEEEEWTSGTTALGRGGVANAKAKAEPGAEAASKGGGGVNAIEGLLNALIGSGTGTDARGKVVARSKVVSAAEGAEEKDEKVQGVRVKTLMSMPTQISRNVEFRNLSKRSVQLHWVDFKGVEQKCASAALLTAFSESSNVSRALALSCSMVLHPCSTPCSRRPNFPRPSEGVGVRMGLPVVHPNWGAAMPAERLHGDGSYSAGTRCFITAIAR